MTRDQLRLYIVGAGGFGRETLDAMMALRLQPTAFLDDHRCGEVIRGLPVIAPDESSEGAKYVVAISNHHARQRLATSLNDRRLTAVQIIHPHAILAPETTIGPGCVILAGAYVSSNVTLGAHVHINYNATVGHDSQLGSFSTVLPGSNVSGEVNIGSGVTVGANATVLPGIRIGHGATVGAGAVVTRDISDHTIVAGVPARPLHT